MKGLGRTLSGLEVFLGEHASSHEGESLGLLMNQASVGPGYEDALSLLDARLPGAVSCLFGPQHGFRGESQDNMVESPHSRTADGREIHSLYSGDLEPSERMLEGLDWVVCDLQDAGTRVYTFAHTLSLLLGKCAGAGVGVIVLDRPNPIGGDLVEGNLLDPDCGSFVGLHPIPMRHGLTMGELARLMNGRLKEPARLEVVPMRGWRRSYAFRDTGLPWVPPSPNLPTPETALVYPGTVIFEGTNLSEGRGTTQPFQLVGAPYVDPKALKSDLDRLGLPAVAFREAAFQPCFNKWAGLGCRGVAIHPTGKAFRPYLTALAILSSILRRHPSDFALKEPPYEYEYERRPIDLILGRKGIFDALADGACPKELCEGFKGEEDLFRRSVRDHLLYA
jgi:uncharacterized protein YbbC (DUF1343 family)